MHKSQNRHNPTIEYLDMDASNYLAEDDDDIEAMLDYFDRTCDDKPPKNIIPKTKKLRVRVKRLSHDVVKRYMNRKSPTKMGFTNPTRKRPILQHNKLQVVRVPQDKLQNLLNTSKKEFNIEIQKQVKTNSKRQSLAGQRQSNLLDDGCSLVPNKEPKIIKIKRSDVFPTSFAKGNNRSGPDAKEKLVQIKNDTYRKSITDYFPKTVETPIVAKPQTSTTMDSSNRKIIMNKVYRNVRKPEVTVAEGNIKEIPIKREIKHEPNTQIKVKELSIKRDEKKHLIDMKNTRIITKETENEYIKSPIKIFRKEKESNNNQNSFASKSSFNNPIGIVKHPKIIKVPISKLNKIPVDQTKIKRDIPILMDENPKNVTKHFETVNISKVIFKNSVKVDLASSSSNKIATSNNNQSRVIKIPQTIEILKGSEMVKVAKLPDTQNLPAIKLIKTEPNTNATKKPSNVIISKIIKVPEMNASEEEAPAKIKIEKNFIEIDDEDKVKTMQNQSVQTKFTCNDNVCGIIDTTEFNISCFYCYDVFPLRKWPMFIKHMKTFHRLPEISQKKAESLLESRNITPFGTRSKIVQVNTLRGRDILGKRKKDPPETYTLSSEAMADDMESMCDSQVENDLEAALNELENENEVEEEFKVDDEYSPAPTVLKTESVEEKSSNKSLEQQISPISITINRDQLKKTESLGKVTQLPKKVIILPKNSSNMNLKLIDPKLRIINLPPSLKIIKKLPTKEVTTTVIERDTLNELRAKEENKKVIVQKLEQPTIKLMKNEDSNSPMTEENLDSMDSFTDEIIEQLNTAKKEDTDLEFFNSRLKNRTEEDDNAILDITKKDIEQNVRIEPNFNNKNAEDSDLLRIKDVEKRCKKINTNSYKTTVTQKQAPIPSHFLDSDDEMPSNDENEDEFPSPTNGCGILFGLTNRHIVKEFIKELQKYPELWQFKRNNTTKVDDISNYNESVRRLCDHLNNKFNLDMSDFEMRLSVQRVKYWYCRTLQKVEKHNKMSNANKMPFPHTFPVYFQMLSKFLTYDSNCAKDLVLGKRFQERDINELNRYPKWMVYKGKDIDEETKNNLHLMEEEKDMEEELVEFNKSKYPNSHVCDICYLDFTRLSDLKNHRLRHFSPQFSCPICKRCHYTGQAADRCEHNKSEDIIGPLEGKPRVKNIQKSGPFMCELCGVSYRSMGTLNYHKNDKHYNLRRKCPVCPFTSISNYRMVQHQKRRHIVEFGTCQELLNKTRAHYDGQNREPFSIEARREYEWKKEMRKNVKPGQFFYGCYKCKLVFATRKEKIQHNRQEHPISETTVVCLLCPKERSLFSNINGVRRHYTEIHKVPWNAIDEMVKRTKTLYELITPQEVEELKTSNNPMVLVLKLLRKMENLPKANEISLAIKTITADMENEKHHSFDPFKNDKNQNRNSKNKNRDDEEDSLDDDNDCYQSTFFNDIGIDHGDDDNMDDEDSYYEDEYEENEDYIGDIFYEINENFNDSQLPEIENINSISNSNPKRIQHYEFCDEDGNEAYIIEEECIGDEVYSKLLNDTDHQEVLEENTEDSEKIVEEVVEYDFMEDVMDEEYYDELTYKMGKK